MPRRRCRYPSCMRFLLAAVLLAAQYALAQAPPPALRLPEGVRPLRYAAELEIRPEQAEFRGALEIHAEVSRSTPVVWLNARFLAVERATAGEREATLLPGGDDFIGLRFEPPLEPGSFTLRLEYRGRLSNRETTGAFRQREGRDWYVFTQLEPIYARRLFPCFDEPAYKVPWQLSLIVARENLAVSNTPVVAESD